MLHLAAKYQYNKRWAGWINDYISYVPEFLVTLKAHSAESEFVRIVNAQNNDGWTALDIALTHRHTMAVIALHYIGAAVLPQRRPQQIDQMILKEKDKSACVLSEAEREQIIRLSQSGNLDQLITDLHYIVKPIRRGADQAFIWAQLQKIIDTLDDAQLNHASKLDGYTLLHVAALAEDVVSIKQLLDRNAKASATNHNGITPLVLAGITVNSATYNLLKQKEAQWTPAKHVGVTIPPELEMTTYGISAEMAQDLLTQYKVQDLLKTYRYSVDGKEKETTLFDFAYSHGHFAWVLLLLQMGAKIEDLYNHNE